MHAAPVYHQLLSRKLLSQVETMASLPSSHGGSSTKATKKPWFVTFNAPDVLIWKQGLRLKLQGGMTAGRVVSVSVLDDMEKSVQVSIKRLWHKCILLSERVSFCYNVLLMQLKGNCKEDPRSYTFSAHLSSFETDANLFTKQLAPFIDNAKQFCSKLSELTEGTVKDNSKCEVDDAPGSSTKATKRPRDEAPKIKSKKAKQAEIEEQRKDEVELEIANSEIGTTLIKLAICKVSTLNIEFNVHMSMFTNSLNTNICVNRCVQCPSRGTCGPPRVP